MPGWPFTAPGVTAYLYACASLAGVLEHDPHVTEVVELLTMVLGPSALLVAARIDVADDVSGGGLERAMTELALRLEDDVPDVTEVFLDPTPGR